MALPPMLSYRCLTMRHERNRTMQTILRMRQVKACRGLSRTTHYQQISQGLMTKPIRTGARAVGWPANEIEAINAARIAGKSEDEIRGLVKRLEAARSSGASVR